MHTLKLPRTLLAGLALASFAAVAQAAAPPAPFTATYQVYRSGEAMGEATITLKTVGDGQYEYSNQMRGTSGLAAMLGANSSDVTRFRWNNNAPETVTYNSVQKALKSNERVMQVNWSTGQVSVNDKKGSETYTSTPGMVDRNTMPLALGLALRGGSQSVSLPVGVKQRVEQQQFKVQGTESVTVPAGNFKAERVSRTDSDKHFDAWYVPGKYPLPVKMAQSDGGDLMLQLVRYSGQ